MSTTPGPASEAAPTKRRSTRPSGKPRPAMVAAEHLPVARVAVDLPLMHLDRPFDYLVPAALSEVASPGARVKVRFAGRRVDGYVLQRIARTEHEGRLAFLDTVVSPEPVLTPEVFALARAVADHYVGTVADVLRLAIPPRHARTESEPPRSIATTPMPAWSLARSAAWDVVEGAAQFLQALAEGAAPRAVAVVPPGRDPAALVAHAGLACLASGRDVLVVAPDGRDAERFLGAFVSAGVPAEAVVHLASDVGPAERYRRFLKVLRGDARVVVGARAAAFAPSSRLGLAVLWDDGDDLHAEPRSPYPHVREVLALRSTVGSGCGLLLLGHLRTAEGERLIRSSWAVPLSAPRDYVRDHAPEVRTAADDADSGRDLDARRARIPGMVLRTLRDALTRGPVLVQVPRAGYVPLLRCQDCRSAARCRTCTGPLRLDRSSGAPVCAWCNATHEDWRCASCGGQRLRASRSGVRRTAEELGRALPGVPVITSGRDGIVASVGAAPALVLATPGAEPVAADGYAAVALLDGDRLLDRADLRASEEALRRWANAAALCRTRERDGHVVVVAEPTMPAVQALVRRDPEGFARQEFDERAAAHMPPAARVIALTAAPSELADFLAALDLPRGTEVLGPSPVPQSTAGPDTRQAQDPPTALPRERVVLRVPLASGNALAGAVRAVTAVRSAHKREHVMVQVDPLVMV